MHKILEFLKAHKYYVLAGFGIIILAALLLHRKAKPVDAQPSLGDTIGANSIMPGGSGAYGIQPDDSSVSALLAKLSDSQSIIDQVNAALHNTVPTPIPAPSGNPLDNIAPTTTQGTNNNPSNVAPLVNPTPTPAPAPAPSPVSTPGPNENVNPPAPAPAPSPYAGLSIDQLIQKGYYDQAKTQLVGLNYTTTGAAAGGSGEFYSNVNQPGNVYFIPYT